MKLNQAMETMNSDRDFTVITLRSVVIGSSTRSSSSDMIRRTSHHCSCAGLGDHLRYTSIRTHRGMIHRYKANRRTTATWLIIVRSG